MEQLKQDLSNLTEGLDTINEPENTFKHNFTEEQVLKISQRYKELQKEDFKGLTLLEQQTIILPYLIISRVTAFNINALKPKEKVKKEKVVKEKLPKVKKLTKTEIKKQLKEIITKQAAGITLDDNEQNFLTQHDLGLST